VRELVLAAGCGVTIDRESVPVLPETAAIAVALDLDPLGMLASGSLLVAAEAASVSGLLAACDAIGVQLTRIGEVTDRAGDFTLREHGSRRELPVFESDEVARALSGASGPSPR
jgi:hydrogenase maturation factor